MSLLATLIVTYYQIGIGIMIGKMMAAHQDGSSVFTDIPFWMFVRELTMTVGLWPYELWMRYYEGKVNRRWLLHQGKDLNSFHVKSPEEVLEVDIESSSNPSGSYPHFEDWVVAYASTLVDMASERYYDRMGMTLTPLKVSLYAHRKFSLPGRFRASILLIGNDREVQEAINAAWDEYEQYLGQENA